MRFLVLLAGIAVAAPLHAQATDAFLACARIPADAERLACYDRAVGQVSAEGRRLAAERAAEAERAARARAEAEAAATAEAEAKARADALDRFGAETRRKAAADEPRMDRIEAKVEETFTDGERKRVFVLDNGQIWRQTDGVFLASVRPGSEVIVRRASMGGYTMRVPSLNRTLPVARMR